MSGTRQLIQSEPAFPKAGARLIGMIGLVAFLFLMVGQAKAGDPALVDLFANREVTSDPAGDIHGSNVAASREVGEPRHGGKRGGRSVWLSWVAPSNGIATFGTVGSTFDTLLSAYYFKGPATNNIADLEELSRNDDAPGLEPASQLQFGARAGVRYEIAIDGFNGAAGDIRLRWSFVNATSPPPVTLLVTGDRAARLGDRVTLSVNMVVTPELNLNWRFNGESMPEEVGQDFGTNFVITGLQATNVGRYSLRVRMGNVQFDTTPVEVQVNSEGQTNALARDKLLDSLDTPLLGSDGTAGSRPALMSVRRLMDGVVRGYNGSQIFSTVFATADPSEPVNCAGRGGASYWFTYQSPTNGTVVLDTIGSAFPTALTAYAYTAPLTNYADLIPIRCESATVGLAGAARLEFATVKGRSYAIVVDGVNGAKGIARLNYALDVARPPMPPTLLGQPVFRRVGAGSDVVLSPPVAGSQPLHFLWRRNGVGLDGSTNASLPLHLVAPGDSGDYVVTVSNHVGDPLAVTLSLRVLMPTQLELTGIPGGAGVSFSTVTGQVYVVEQADAMNGVWQEWPARYSGDGSRIFLTNAVDQNGRFYRVRVE